MNVESSRLDVFAARLEPGADVRQSLEAIARTRYITAGVVLGAVGSLSQTRLRFAGQNEHTHLEGKHEILSLAGMLSETGVHLHMCVSNTAGQCIGGHVVYGCVVYTTLELVIGSMPAIIFDRELDTTTGFPELLIRANGAIANPDSE